jgi:hypothetical protein
MRRSACSLGDPSLGPRRNPPFLPATGGLRGPSFGETDPMGTGGSLTNPPSEGPQTETCNSTRDETMRLTEWVWVSGENNNKLHDRSSSSRNAERRHLGLLWRLDRKPQTLVTPTPIRRYPGSSHELSTLGECNTILSECNKWLGNG